MSGGQRTERPPQTDGERQRVCDDDDELSDSQAPTPPRANTPSQGHTPRVVPPLVDMQRPGLPGFTTPIQAYPLSCGFTSAGK